jgi:hypothetical protein
MRFANIPVIILTADGNGGESLRQESDLVLIKPVSLWMLRDLAERLRLSGMRT